MRPAYRGDPIAERADCGIACVFRRNSRALLLLGFQVQVSAQLAG
jgi:hypothetical protein